MHLPHDLPEKVLFPLAFLAAIFIPFVMQKYYEYKHPDEIHFDPEHDSPEVLAFILNKKAKEKEEAEKQWEAYLHD